MMNPLGEDIDDGYHADKSRNDLDSTNDNLDDSKEDPKLIQSPSSGLIDLKSSGYFRSIHDNNCGTIENHVSQFVQPEQQKAFHKIVSNELKEYGVIYEVYNRQSRTKSRKSPRAKTGIENVKTPFNSQTQLQLAC